MSDPVNYNLKNPIDVATLLVNKLQVAPALLQGVVELTKREQDPSSGEILAAIAHLLDNQIVIMAALQAVAIPAAQMAHQRSTGIVVPGARPFPRRVQ